MTEFKNLNFFAFIPGAELRWAFQVQWAIAGKFDALILMKFPIPHSSTVPILRNIPVKGQTKIDFHRRSYPFLSFRRVLDLGYLSPFFPIGIRVPCSSDCAKTVFVKHSYSNISEQTWRQLGRVHHVLSARKPNFRVSCGRMLFA